MGMSTSGGIVTDKIVVMVTAGKPGEARKIAKQLVESKLAACVNITQPVRSVYRWQGKLVEDKEFVLLVKTSRELFPAVRAQIAKLHSYTTPEIICLPIIDGSTDYLNWLADSLNSSEEKASAEQEKD
jgi:periplasmic divalent cation tolerance protein